MGAAPYTIGDPVNQPSLRRRGFASVEFNAIEQRLIEPTVGAENRSEELGRINVNTDAAVATFAGSQSQPKCSVECLAVEHCEPPRRRAPRVVARHATRHRLV